MAILTHDISGSTVRRSVLAATVAFVAMAGCSVSAADAQATGSPAAPPPLGWTVAESAQRGDSIASALPGSSASSATGGAETRRDGLSLRLGGLPASTPVSDPIASDSDSGCVVPRSFVAPARVVTATAFAGGNVYLWHYFKKAWWSGEPAPHFFYHADWDQQFRDQDKFGHLFGGYHLARLGYDALRYSCVGKGKAMVLSAAYAAMFQLQIEVFDGRYRKYGFSYADMLANSTGQALAVMQELHPTLRAIKPTFSYHETPALKRKANSSELRPSLDYSGQTYWFSLDVKQLLPDDAKPFWPAFLRVSAGHSITDWVDPETCAVQRARRKILLSLDFDPTALPGSNPMWRSILRQLSYYHLPAPALQLTPRFAGIAWYR